MRCLGTIPNSNQIAILASKEDIENKIQALNFYESQKYKNYVDEDFIWSLAKVRGVQIKEKYAEALK